MKINNSNNLLKFSYYIVYNVSLVIWNLLNSKQTWNFIYLPKLVSTE